MSWIEGKSVVVTGGAGFIGSHLTDTLSGAGAARVTVIDDLSTGSRSNLGAAADRIELVVGDVCRPDVAARAADADVVFHLAVRNVRASINRPAENLRVNAAGTLEVLEAMRQGAQGRFIYVSSSEIYGIPAAGSYSETIVPAPTTVYGAGKLAGEHIALAYHRTYGMNTRVIRPFNNYGPRSHFEGDSGEVIPKFILRAMAGMPLLIHGSGEQTRDFMYVGDTAHWLLELAEVDRLEGDTVNIGSGRDRSINELAAVILERTGSSSEAQHVDPRPGDLPRLCADVTKVSSIVPFALPTGFEAGLDATIEYFAGFDPHELLAAERDRNWE